MSSQAGYFDPDAFRRRKAAKPANPAKEPPPTRVDSQPSQVSQGSSAEPRLPTAAGSDGARAKAAKPAKPPAPDPRSVGPRAPTTTPMGHGQLVAGAPPASDPCITCGGRARWRLPAGAWRCRRCHPPAVSQHLVVDEDPPRETEFREIVDEVAAERDWLAQRDLLLPADGDAAELRAHFDRLCREQGLHAALAEARRHSVAAGKCKVLSLSAPHPGPRPGPRLQDRQP